MPWIRIFWSSTQKSLFLTETHEQREREREILFDDRQTRIYCRNNSLFLSLRRRARAQHASERICALRRCTLGASPPQALKANAPANAPKLKDKLHSPEPVPIKAAAAGWCGGGRPCAAAGRLASGLDWQVGAPMELAFVRRGQIHLVVKRGET